jgi:hypothetical protein
MVNCITAIVLSLAGPQVGDKDLTTFVEKLGGKVKPLTYLKDVEAYSVDLKGTDTADADLAVLARMKGIYYLDLSFTRVTDKGVASLTGCKDLRGLVLTGTKTTNAIVDALRAMPELQDIDVAQTAVTEDAVAQLVKGKSLVVTSVSLGDKAHFRVHREFVLGELNMSYLMIGDTYFGSYFSGKVAKPGDPDPKDRRRLATTYYHRDGPVGQVMAKLEWFKPAHVLDYPSDVRLPASLVGMFAPSGPMLGMASPFGPGPGGALVALWSEPAIGVVRLNVGTHAAYGRPCQHIHFYNSTPELKVFSLPPPGQPVYFGFIQDALKRGCCIKVFDGAERPTLGKKAPRKFYSALFVEITRHEQRDINTALLTKEALAEMMETLTETGVLCFDTSHRYHNVKPAIADAAKSLNLAWKVGKDLGNYPHDRTHFGSEWVMVARKAEYLSHLTDVKTKDRQLEWQDYESLGQHLWRDGQKHDLKGLEYPQPK